MRLASALRSPIRAVLAATLVIAAGCDLGEGESLYDPNRESLPTPEISEIVTDAPIVLAGIDVITVNGSNFSATPSDNLVYFGEISGETLEASPTRLRVRVPNVPSDNLPVRVTVIGAPSFSNTARIGLVPALTQPTEFGRSEEAFGSDVDDDGNLFVSLTSEGLSTGVQRIAPDGSRTVWFDASSATWSDLAISPTGEVYGARGIRAVFRLPQGAAQQTVAALPNGVALSAIDFDAAGNLWAGGNNAALYRIAPDGTPTSFPFQGNVRGLDVSGDALYAAVTRDDQSRILRVPITGGALGAPEELANVTAFNGRRATAIAVAASGDIYVGTTDGEPVTADRDPILYLPQGGSLEVLYPGVLDGAVTSLAYGTGTGLFFARAPSTATAITPATRPNLFRVETRQPGAP